MNHGTIKKANDSRQVVLNHFNPEQEVRNEEWFEKYSFKKNQIIFHQGNTPMGVYYVLSGKVKFTRNSEDGTRHIIRIGAEGDFLGYEDVLLDRKYSNTVEAWGDVVLYFIPRKDFTDVLDNDIKASRKFSQMLSENLLDTEARLVVLAHKPVRGRLADALLSLSYYFNHNDTPVSISLTRHELANMIGTAPETVVRMLADFKDEKIISTERKAIRILDEKRLIKTTEMYN